MTVCPRFALVAVFSALWLSLVPFALCQSDTATLSGLITDPQRSVVPGVEVVVTNVDTNVAVRQSTNNAGIYVITGLKPGHYRVSFTKGGFRRIDLTDLVLSVQDTLSRNLQLEIGSAETSITVSAEAATVNTTDAAVSTVIDRNFVENLPLNGRSFNTLLQLTPSVVVAPAGSSNQGQFSIAGQRTTANNLLIDGMSANFGVATTLGQGTAGTGAAQAFSILGGTSSLVSVEALQEFRIETSSFAPEFGRSPGGQIILTTRSGTNDLHGGIYEYFRNDVLDANDWFANHNGKPRAAERHNDFGGFLGGPIQRDKTFFFLSYEGARLRQPNTRVAQVPSEYARSIAPNSVAPFLNAYPQPDDRSITPGAYTATFTGNFSNPATLDAGSVRIDHVFGNSLSVFGRYNESPSETAQRSQSLNEVDTSKVGTRTLTISATTTFRSSLSNTTRVNYSVQNASFVSHLDSFGDATPLDLSTFAPGLQNPGQAYLGFYTFDTGFYATGPNAKNRNTQLNIANDIAILRGKHQLKFGADYRALYLDVRPFASGLTYEALSVSSLISTQSSFFLVGSSAKPTYLLSQATSLYGQDTWKITPRLTVTWGLRWELNPAPSARKGTDLSAWDNLSDPAAITLASPGTKLWNTKFLNIAPRVGVAYSFTEKQDLVLRAGWGVFYDVGADTVGNLANNFPNNAGSFFLDVPLPITDSGQYLPSNSLQPPYPDLASGFSRDLALPRSYQWNTAIEKSFGGQAISLSYVGQSGRRLLRQEALQTPNPNFEGVFLLTQNNAQSNYNALQFEYRRPLSRRLQALASYTWSHSLDNASDDVVTAASSTVISAAKDYASSDFDVRHSFSGALTYGLPSLAEQGPLAYLSKDWSIRALLACRSGFPFNASVLTGGRVSGVYPRPDLVPGQPLWISDPTAAAGKTLNPLAFAAPAPGTQGTEPRNDIRGFGLVQVDMSLGRKFSIADHINLQFNADAFNILNHPNFANPLGYYLDPSTTVYLQSTQMLNHGLGGLNSLFQQGGPRSLQLSLKLNF